MDNNKKVLVIQESAEDHQWQIVNRIKETPDTFTLYRNLRKTINGR